MLKQRRFGDLYELKEEIGRGAFGVVHRCVEKSSRRHFAAKFVEVGNSEEEMSVMKEIEIMKECTHAKLLQLQDAFQTDTEIIMVMEL